MGTKKTSLSPLGLTTTEIAAALKRYEVLCEHHTDEPPCTFYRWEEEALARIFAKIKDDPDAVALLCNMIQYCMEKDQGQPGARPDYGFTLPQVSKEPLGSSLFHADHSSNATPPRRTAKCPRLFLFLKNI